MTPMQQPFNAFKAPFKAQLRVWIKPDGENEDMRAYMLRRYQNGELYWSPLQFTPAGGALCLQCFGPWIAAGDGEYRRCATCGADTQTLAVPM